MPAEHKTVYSLHDVKPKTETFTLTTMLVNNPVAIETSYVNRQREAQATLCVLIGAFLRDCAIAYTDFTTLRSRRCVHPEMRTLQKRNNVNDCFC